MQKLVIYPLVPHPGIGNQCYGMHFVTVDAEEAFSVRYPAWRLLPIVISIPSLTKIEQGYVLNTILAFNTFNRIRVKGDFNIRSGSRFRLIFWNHWVFGLRHCDFLPIQLIFTVTRKIMGRLLCILGGHGGTHSTVGMAD